MGPFATAVLIACLAAMRVLFYATALLALVALVFQGFRGDLASPSSLIAVIAAGALLGWMCAIVSKRLGARDS